MSIAAKPRRENRTITVDFHDEATYFRLIDDGKAFVECVLAFLPPRAFNSTRLPVAVVGASRVTPIMRASGWVGSRSGGSSARHAEPFTVLPTSSCAIVRCDRKSPAMPCCDARWAQFGTVRRPLPYLPHGALPPRLCGWPPESGRRPTRCGLPLPVYVLADEKHSRCLSTKVYLPTIGCGRVLWHLGYTTEASAAAFTESYQVFQRVASQQEPSYRVRGALTDGFDSTTKSLRTRFRECVSASVCVTPSSSSRRTDGDCVASTSVAPYEVPHPALPGTTAQEFACALGQRLRHFVDHVTHIAGEANGERVRRWCQEKKTGWYAVLADSQMPVTSTLLDQAHNAIERKLFMMKGFHHPQGSQQAFDGAGPLYNLIPYQRRAIHAGQCGVEVEGGTVPTRDWLLNLQILTSGG